MMRNLYSRLFKYRESKKISPLENFLTEGVAHLLDRLSPVKTGEFVRDVLLSGCAGSDELKSNLINSVSVARSLEWATQRPVVSDGPRILDLLLLVDNVPTVIVENKVDSDASDQQLLAYDKWLFERNRSGALIFLTHWTEAPQAFLRLSSEYTIPVRSVCRWNSVYKWLNRVQQNDNSGNDASYLKAELSEFLKERNMGFDEPLAIDFAISQNYYLTADGKLRNAFLDLRSFVQKTVSKGTGFSDFNVHDGGHVIWGWCYPDREGLGPNWFAGWGVLFPGGEFFSDLLSDPPRRELVFCVLGSDKGDLPLWKYPEAQRPSGWLWPNHEQRAPRAIACRPLADFYSDPVGFSQAVKTWLKPRLDETLIVLKEMKTIAVS